MQHSDCCRKAGADQRRLLLIYTVRFKETLTANNRAMAKPVDVSKKMSEKMLLGWALLGDSCPASTCVGVPLMREPKTKLLHCIQCGRKGHSVEEMEAKVEAETVSNGGKIESSFT